MPAIVMSFDRGPTSKFSISTSDSEVNRSLVAEICEAEGLEYKASSPSFQHKKEHIADNTKTSAQDTAMTSPSREEIDAKLSAAEARIETRIVSIEHSLNAIAKGQEESIASGKSTRHVIIGTGVAVVLGIAAFNATVLSNMVASFESGKNTAGLLSSAEKSIAEATRALEAAAKASAAPPPANSPPAVSSPKKSK